MKYFCILSLLVLCSYQAWANNYKVYDKGSEMTYAQTWAYCQEDGEEWIIPNKALLSKVIVMGELQDLDMWFWSSTRAPNELCDGEVCYYQIHTRTLDERIRKENDWGHGLCVTY